MRLSAAAAVCLALLLSTALPAVAGSVTVAGASAAAGTRPVVRELTLHTDAMPTRVTVRAVDGRITCLRVATGPGRDRRVWVSVSNAQRSWAYVRLRARSRTGCLLGGAAAPRGTRVDVVVEEDVLGPFDPRAEGSLTL